MVSLRVERDINLEYSAIFYFYILKKGWRLFKSFQPFLGCLQTFLLNDNCTRTGNLRRLDCQWLHLCLHDIECCWSDICLDNPELAR